MIFLRPWALLLLLLPIVFYLIQKKGASITNPWKKYIQSVFLPHLIVQKKISIKQNKTFVLITLIWFLLCLALSGPAFDKIPTKGVKDAPATVLVVDLNTLNAEKIAQLHIKLYEILEQLKGNQIGIVLYDTKGYVAAPLTQDTEMLKSLIPSLQPQVMPDLGNYLDKGIETAITLLKNIQTGSGRILLITGGTPDTANVRTRLQNESYTMGILSIGSTQTGEPVLSKNGSFLRTATGDLILSKPNKEALEEIGIYYPAQPDGTEIKKLIQATQPKNSPFLSTQLPHWANSITQMDVWQDLGVYIVILAFPFMLLLFRKGIFYVLLGTLVLTASTNCFAGIWLRPDQESYRTIQNGNKQYQLKNYQKALETYQSDSSVESLYNQGNTWAHLKEYEKAIEAYETVLKTHPSHADAKFNKEYIEKQLKKQDKNQNNSTQKNQENESDSKENNNENQPQSNSTNQEEENKQSDTSDNNNTSNNPNSSQKQDESASQDSSKNLNNTTQDETNKNGNGSQIQQQDAQQGSDSSDNTQQPTDTSQQIQNTLEQQEYSDSDDKNPDTTTIQSNRDLDEQAKQHLSDEQDGYMQSPDLTSDAPDQETEQIINRLKKDPSRVLRYRLYKQYIAQ